MFSHMFLAIKIPFGSTHHALTNNFPDCLLSTLPKKYMLTFFQITHLLLFSLFHSHSNKHRKLVIMQTINTEQPEKLPLTLDIQIAIHYSINFISYIFNSPNKRIDIDVHIALNTTKADSNKECSLMSKSFTFTSNIYYVCIHI
jgi:hypothetical protein